MDNDNTVSLKEKKEHIVKQQNAFVSKDPEKEELIKKSLIKKEAIKLNCGALATWTPLSSTGRSPKDTYIVKDVYNEENIDWDSPNNIPIEKDLFNSIFDDALEILKDKEEIFVTNKVVGADSKYSMPIITVTDKALVSLFTNNMFREPQKDQFLSVFSSKPFTLLALPYDYVNTKKYEGKLRKLENGQYSDMVIAMDLKKQNRTCFRLLIFRKY